MAQSQLSIESVVRPRAYGKFIQVGERSFWIRGVTYGMFRPGPDGSQFPSQAVVERDFAAMATTGFNAVRTYMMPPTRVLDAAARHGLRVMVGLSWPGHLTFLDDRQREREIVASVRADAQQCAGHPAVLCLSIGNEIPAPIVRWHGAGAVARHLQRLYETVKDVDPATLVTYVNYPTTEYLELPFLDLVCFNVYLESRERLAAYLARLQNIAGDRPLVMGELGLDSVRNGEIAQATSLAGQIRTTFDAGAAGAFVYAWTDEWYADGQDVDEWAFGLTRRDRTPKPALAAVRDALADVPPAPDASWPEISVILCSYNGARTIRETLEGLRRLAYPRYEVIVVNDGSTDATPAIAREYDVRFISGPNRGLSHARNVGARASRGEIVAYIDDDAWPDPHWLTYLAAEFRRTSHAGIGGPNIPPPDADDVATCVANAPGGPVHVLLSDTEAEHIPGCNMAFRKSALEAVGGFDEQFRRAGDDVDVCWRLQAHGMTLGFSPAAMVWHRRRDSVAAYFRQQRGYGEAESMLERKWPDKYNVLGHAVWAGRLYGRGAFGGLTRRTRIYHGTWGGAPFQSVYRAARSGLSALALTPEWYLLLAALLVFSLVGLSWKPLMAAVPLAALGAAVSVACAVRGAATAVLPGVTGGRRRRRMRLLTAWLHLVQPLARLRGRLDGGLTPWRRRGHHTLAFPCATTWTVWTPRRRDPHEWLASLEATLRRRDHVVARGGNWDTWDLEIRTGMLGAVRVLMTHEEHGRGRQLVRFRLWPRATMAFLTGLALIALSVLATAAGATLAAVALACIAVFVGARSFVDSAMATAAVRDASSATARTELHVRAPAVPELDADAKGAA